MPRTSQVLNKKEGNQKKNNNKETSTTSNKIVSKRKPTTATGKALKQREMKPTKTTITKVASRIQKPRVVKNKLTGVTQIITPKTTKKKATAASTSSGSQKKNTRQSRRVVSPNHISGDKNTKNKSKSEKGKKVVVKKKNTEERKVGVTKKSNTAGGKNWLRRYNLAYARYVLMKTRPSILKRNDKQLVHARLMSEKNKKSLEERREGGGVSEKRQVQPPGPRVFKHGKGKVAVLGRVSIEKSVEQFLPEMNHIVRNIIKRIAKGTYANMYVNSPSENNAPGVSCKIRVMPVHVENGLEDMGYKIHHPSNF